jgi:hypothetical protein
MKPLLTPAQQKFIELERKKTEVKKYFEELRLATEAVAAEIGLDCAFQDDEGVVYQIVEPTGTFVTFEKISYIRTRRPEETKGTLSMKKAEELGFKVKE